MSGDSLLIGKIARPHGVRGELKVKLFYEESDSLEGVESIELKPPRGLAKRYEIEALRGTKKAPILALVGVETREAAEALKEHEVFVRRADLPPLEEGEYYLVDVVGCEVFVSERSLGKVTAVRPDPSVDTLVITTPDGKTLEQPLLPQFVAKVDVGARKVELSSEDGLID